MRRVRSPVLPSNALDEYRVLHEEVARLPEKYRAAIVLCYLEGLTQDQAAESLRWPVGTVRGNLARARELLRARLVRRGVAPLIAIGLLESPAKAALSPPLIESVLVALVHSTAAPTAAALVGPITRALAASRLKPFLVAAMLLAVGAAGAGLGVALSGPGAVPVVAAQPVANPGRRDRVNLQGDPLPDGAVARLGTSRFNHGIDIQAIAYTPDGKGLVSFGRDGRVHVWESSTGRLMRTVAVGGPQGAYLFALSPDGRRLATADRSQANDFKLWDFETGRELRRVPCPEPRMYFDRLRYSPDGKTLVTALVDHSIVFLDSQTLKEVRRIKVGSNYVQHMDCSPDGQLLAATVEAQLAHMDRMMPAGGMGRVAESRDPPTPEPSEKASLAIWKVANGAELTRIEIRGCHPDGLLFSPDGHRLVASFCDRTIRFYDPRSGRERERINVSGSTRGRLAFSHDGTILALGTSPYGSRPGDAAEIRLFDVSSEKELRRFPASDQVVFDLTFSPDDRRLVSSGGDKFLRLWEVATGREINAVASHRSSVACLAVSPADNSVITGGYDDTIRRWDPTTGHALGVIGRHPGALYDLAISPDGRFLLAADIERNVRLWDLAVQEPAFRSLTINPDSRGRSLAISPDGRLAASSGKISDVAAAPRSPRSSMRRASHSSRGRGRLSLPTTPVSSRRTGIPCGYGMWPAASRCARSPSRGIRSSRWPSLPTAGSWRSA